MSSPRTLLPCEGAHNKLVVRLSLLASSSCERLQATWTASQQLIVITKVFFTCEDAHHALVVRALHSVQREEGRRCESASISCRHLKLTMDTRPGSSENTKLILVFAACLDQSTDESSMELD